MKQISAILILLLLCLGFLYESSAQLCQKPKKQVVLYDGVSDYYVYWKPQTIPPVINYKVGVKCTNFPPCAFTVMVDNSNVLYMNGGYLGVKIPSLPSPASAIELSIFHPDCPEKYTVAFIITVIIITDDLGLSTGAFCDGDTCKMTVNNYKTLPELTDLYTELCGGVAGAAPGSRVTAIDAPVDILLRRNANGKWQIKTLDTLYCDSCYTFNFQITCPDGATHYAMDTVCFNYTGPDVGCRIADTGNDPEEFKIYPNPASDEITIEFYLEAKGEGTLYISDLLGRVMPLNGQPSMWQAGWNRITIPVKYLSDGTYFISLNAEGKVFRARFVK